MLPHNIMKVAGASSNAMTASTFMPSQLLDLGSLSLGGGNHNLSTLLQTVTCMLNNMSLITLIIQL